MNVTNFNCGRLVYMPLFALLIAACSSEDLPDTKTETVEAPKKAADYGQEVESANAKLRPKSGSSVEGSVSFRHDAERNGLLISIEASGLEPGLHGFHIHETGNCSGENASTAGGHFNPENNEHGDPNNASSHAGDLGNIRVADDGSVQHRVFSKTLTFTGETSVVGKAVVIHQQADDLESQPSGAAGKRVACGVILPLLKTAAGSKYPQEDFNPDVKQ